MRSNAEEQRAAATPLELAPQRLALPSDAPRISKLMRASTLDLFLAKRKND